VEREEHEKSGYFLSDRLSYFFKKEITKITYKIIKNVSGNLDNL
jgi:hypothetical protein